MSFWSQSLISGHHSLSQRRITCYWLEGQTVVMRKGIIGFHFRAFWLSDTKVSLCVCVLMIHCFFSMPIIFLSHQILQPVTDSAAFFCLLLYTAPPPLLFSSAYQSSAFMLDSGTTGAAVINICKCAASNTSKRHPLVCQLEDINQLNKILA